MSTVAWPSQASVMALSAHVAGLGVYGAAGSSRPHSANRSRRKRALHDEDIATQAVLPALASAPVARNVRRLKSRPIALFSRYRWRPRTAMLAWDERCDENGVEIGRASGRG